MVDAQATPQKVHPILRNPALPTRAPSPTSMSPRSQVRFSVPDTDLLHETQASISESPSKIVFPKSSQDNTSEISNDAIDDGILTLGKGGHFMDMHSRVMVDIPEEIWNFHSRKRLAKHRRSKSTGSQASTGNLNDENNLEMSRSLQAIIVDTLDSMGKFRERYRAENFNSGNFSGASRVSPLNYRRKINYNLYLTPYSPLNNYNVPIPLEISLPPYLSSENKDKIRESLVFDGKGYSPFDGISPYDISTEEENVDDEKSLNQTSHASTETDEETSISADSIPSAVHDISFDVNSLNDVDHELGIDEDANVNLKVQRKNLKKQSPSRSIASTKTPQSISASKNLNDQEVPKLLPSLESDIEDEPPLDQEGIEEENEDTEKREEEIEHGTPTPMTNRKSLDILETPSKQIYIPDFDLEPTPATSSAGSLKFFDAIENSEEGPRSNPNREVGNLDLDFKFPPLPPKDDDDFMKVDNSPTNPQFEARRNRLLHQKVLSPGGRRHMHSRSRSMHSAQDMFSTATSNPSMNATFADNIGDLPLRQSHSIHEKDTSFELDSKPKDHVPSEDTRSIVEDDYGLPVVATPSARVDAELPITPSSTGRNRKELAMTPTPFSRRRCGKQISPASFGEHVNEVELTPESEPFAEHEVESDSSSLYEEVHASRNKPASQTEEPFFDDEKTSLNLQSPYNKTDESLRIISEKKLDDDHFAFPNEHELGDIFSSTPLKSKAQSSIKVNPVKPMTTIHSFVEPVVPPENEYENMVSMPSDHNKVNYNLLSPRRSLSNNGSQSSGNSQFSKQTNQSSRTSYPTEREGINPLVENLKKSDIPDLFSYPLSPVPNDTMKFQRHSMPLFDFYNGSVPSFRKTHEESSAKNNSHLYSAGRNLRNSGEHAASNNYEKPENVSIKEPEGNQNIQPKKVSKLELPHDNQRNSHRCSKSKSFQETNSHLDYPWYGYDSSQIQYSEMQEQNQQKDNITLKGFHEPRRSVQSYMTNDLYGPENYKMLEDYQSINHRLGGGNNVEVPTDGASYAHRLAPSGDFRDVLETLNNMTLKLQISGDPNRSNPDYRVSPKTPMNIKKTTSMDSSNEGYHTEYEERDGKMVEVLVLDDDSDENMLQNNTKGSSVSPIKALRQGSPNKSHEEILKMCEDTASHAKKVILQLVDDKKNKKVRGKKRLSRPPPPNSIKDLDQNMRSAPSQVNNHRNGSTIGQERYLRNLNRAIKPRPHSYY